MPDVEFAAIVIALGSLLFVFGGAMPTSRVFQEANPTRKLQIIDSARAVWLVSQIGFAVGPTIAALGLAILAVGLSGSPAAPLGYLGTALLLIAVVCWDWHVYLRAVDPEAFTQGLMPAWLFQVYTVLTCLGLAVFGGAFLPAGYPVWLGSLMIVVGLASLIAFLVTKDMVPFVYYLLLLLVAWMVGPGWIGPTVLAATVASVLAFIVVKPVMPDA